MKFKKITLITSLLCFNCAYAQIPSANPNDILGDPRNIIRSDEIPAGEEGRYYIPGSAAGADSIPTTSYSKTFKMGAGFSLGLNRQCGQLNPFKNMTAQLKAQVKEKAQEYKAFIKTLPQQIASQAVEYALIKINPDLYQLLQLNLSEYFELFEINVKTCEDVQTEMASNPNADPLSHIAQIAIADEWKRTIGTDGFVNSRNIKAQIEDRASKAGMKMADGKSYGGEGQEPINFIKSMAIAGINTITGRTNKSSWNSSFGASEKEKAPILRYFNSPQELVDFIENIYGSEELSTYANGGAGAVSTKAGVGYGQEYSRIRNRNLVALKQYMQRKITRQAFEKQTLILMPPIEMEDIRQMPPYQQQQALEDKAKQTAIDELTIKLKLAKDALSAGVKAADMVQSSLSEMARNRQKALHYRILDDIAELHNSRY
ncbi:integrating conjugative element protein, PFL_4711 family [Suttonella ornithocola]|uniref:Integrating conjugative element protein, PFL_4711 family n=2 Tax=Suttonella ornithocola TaxID=279832 RepID=A0A380MWP4_9GAMM|nr:integrating conjugative element protein, PFL_4711 family [Suttonella ornithocola]